MSTELILPKATTPEANAVVDVAPRMIPLLPSHVDPKQFAGACVIAANELTERCSVPSVLMAAFNCARMGLMPGKTLGLAYFVPFRGVCTLIPGYRGLMDLAYSNGFIASIHAEVICQGEEFERWVDQTGPKMRHVIPIDRDLSPRNIVGAYAVWQTRSGVSDMRVITRQEIEAASKGGPVWKNHFVEVAMKTAVRRASKYWKITPQLALAVELDEQAERGEPQSAPPEVGSIEPARRPLNLDEIPDEPPANMAPPPSADELIARIKAATDGDALGQQWEFAQELHSAGAYDDDTFGRVRSAYLARKAALKI